MPRIIISLWATACLFAVAMGAAGPARADWRKAESERFIVYSEGDAAELAGFTRKLETFDRLLRLRMGLSVDETPPRKLPIYLVGSAGGLRRVSPDIGDNVAGFYRASEEDIFAVAMRGEMGDHILLHEYAHHFMYQNFPYSYPSWFSEGFAEYFATVEITDEKIVVGKHNDARGSWLRGSNWVGMSDLLARRAGEVRRRSETYYPLAWLLTHWFLGNEARGEQLNAYLREVGAGGDAIEAMPRATGMPNHELRQQLRRYMSRIPYYEMQNSFPVAAVTVTELPPSANDLLLMTQRLTAVPEGRSAATLAEVRRLAARYPDDPAALVALGHAEIHLGDRDAGEAALRRLLDADPSHVQGLQFLAVSLMERAEEEGADRSALRREARGLLGRAFQVDDANYRTFMLLAESREGEPGYPNDNDVATRELALQLAPQLARARMDAAEIYLAIGRKDDAIRIIEPLANSPHGGGAATAAQALLDRARGLTEAEAQAEAEAADKVEDGDGDGDGDPPPAA